MNFSHNLKTARNSLGISQRELADRLGVVQGAIGNWENGTLEPRLNQLEDIAKALKATPSELIK